jgi:hypothetical protein
VPISVLVGTFFSARHWLDWKRRKRFPGGSNVIQGLRFPLAFRDCYIVTMRIKNLILVAAAMWLAHPLLLCADDQATLNPVNLNPVTALEQWGRYLAIDDRVVTEINAFASPDEPFPDGYGEALALDLRTAALDAAENGVRQIIAGEAKPFVEVTYPLPGFNRQHRPPPDDVTVEKFEQGFIRTEGIALIHAPKTTPSEAMSLYVSKDFRKGVSSRVARLWDEGSLDCIETSGVTGLLSPTHCCNSIHTLDDNNLAAEHAQVVSNGDTQKYQPFFFKESIKTFVQLPDDIIAIHYINYSRSVKLGRIKRALGTGKVRDSQQRRFDSLQEQLDAKSN